jgi:hypothetical protein
MYFLEKEPTFLCKYLFKHEIGCRLRILNNSKRDLSSS